MSHRIWVSCWIFIACAGLVFCGLSFYEEQNKNNSFQSEEGAENSFALEDRIDLAVDQENELTMDPLLGYVPKERLLTALDYTNKLLEDQKKRYRVAGPIPSVNWTERGPSNVGGRTRVILVDPNDPTHKSVFAAGVGGGIWKTTDITLSSPAWTPVNDFFSNIAVSSLAFDPLSPTTIYMGTGEGFFNGDAIRGLGIWKSTDGGVNWSQLASTNSSNFYYVQRIAVHPVNGHVFAATRSGLYKSANGGSTWTKVLGNGTGASSDGISDVEIAADNSVWAAIGLGSTDGIYKSNYAGTTTGDAGTFSKKNSGANGFPTGGMERIEIACAPSNSNVVYAVAENASGGDVLNVYKTTDGGTTWSALTMPTDADPGVAPAFSRSQAWYDLSCAVDPNNPNSVFVGGVDLFKTSNGGSTWQQVSHWYGGYGFQNVHADQHLVIFEPSNSNVAYFGNDGGVWRTANATAATPTIINKVNSYNVTQYYACAVHPTAYTNYFLAGAQDNGSHQFNFPGINNTVSVTGGDGCFCHIDQDQPQYQWTSYVYNNYFRSTDGGSSWNSVNFGNTGRFVNPTDYDNISNIFYAGDSAKNYLRWTDPQSGNTMENILITNFATGAVTHVSVSPNTANRVFFGLGNGRVVMVDNANTVASGSSGTLIGLPAMGSVSSIAIEQGNDNHLLVTYSNYGLNSVWECTNALAATPTFTSVEGNLPDMPVRWAIFNPLNNQQAMLATEVGVWTTDQLSGGGTTWAPSNSGLANTRVDMLQYRTSDNLVAAATHGRGLFTSDVFMTPHADFSGSPIVTYLYKPVQFNDGSAKATSWDWDFGDGTFSTLRNPTHAYSSPGLYTVTLTINGNNLYKKIRTSYIQILPNRGTPYTVAGGAAGTFDINPIEFGANNISGTPFERGNSAIAGKSGTVSSPAAWVTGLTSLKYVDNSEAALYCPNYNFTTPGTYTFSFYGKWVFENTWDGMRLEYSLDKGTSWTYFGAVAPSWYNYANTAGGRPFPTNEPFFSGTVSSFTKFSTDVSFLGGNQNVAFRFVFRSDESVVAAGVAVDNFEITGPANGPLPVTLLFFDGIAKDHFNRLNWSTASEENNSGFDIERSEDGSNFVKIGFVTGNGTTSQISEYHFDDNEISSELYYYRLRQIDYDGQFTFSKTIALRNRFSENAEVDFIFPDPFEDKINIHFSHPFQGEVVFDLFDETGKKVVDNFRASGEENPLVLTTGKNLASGIYYLKISTSNFTAVRKLLRR